MKKLVIVLEHDDAELLDYVAGRATSDAAEQLGSLEAPEVAVPYRASYHLVADNFTLPTDAVQIDAWSSESRKYDAA